MKYSIIIPMYNEKKIVEQSAKTLSAYCAERFSSECEILFVNDGSTDGCEKLLDALALPNVRLLGYEKNRGKGYAVRTGMLAARGEFRLFTDTDLAYGTEVIGEAFSLWEADPSVDLVIGSRRLAEDGYEGYTFPRRLASKAYLWLLRTLGGFRFSDSQSGFKGFSARAAERIFPLCETDRFAFDFEALSYASRMKMKVKEMPIRVLVHGESKIRLVGDSVKMFGDILKIRRRVKRKMKEQDHA